MFDSSKFYSIADVIRIIGISRATVWRWSKSGKMPPIHGSCHRFRGDELKRWCDEGRDWSEIITSLVTCKPSGSVA
ncbi:MAG: helix-turn-helix domain-containing protein [Planctomycetes bacterium]|nr:helix-turn-helix domain-containing protein [Planctomycetota bacterium]